MAVCPTGVCWRIDHSHCCIPCYVGAYHNGSGCWTCWLGSILCSEYYILTSVYSLFSLSLRHVECFFFQNWVVRSASEVEQNIVSVERVLHQTEVSPEAPQEIPEAKPSGVWPSEGLIEFRCIFIYMLERILINTINIIETILLDTALD